MIPGLIYIFAKTREYRMKKRMEDFKVLDNKSLNEEYFILKLQSQRSIPEILPGQFAQVKIEDSPGTFLRRPFSIYDVDYSNNTLLLLIKIVGDGSYHLSLLKKGEKINLIYPLGNSFSKPEGQNVLLIGGGTGVAPMLLLGKYLSEKYSINPNFLLGYRTENLIIEIEKFKSVGKVYITTEDGSAGHKGYVTNHPVLKKELDNLHMIYTCGPELMMRGVAAYAHRNKITCEASLENLMGCGIGACLCCIVETTDRGNLNTCTEGPIFNSEKLKWQI
jgi:dihydroorotate dehydrogenase electron transfer subunit